MMQQTIWPAIEETIPEKNEGIIEHAIEDMIQ
jgi:hypothetical protein